jgi:tetratricopeptide (TPR) repeat protein
MGLNFWSMIRTIPLFCVLLLNLGNVQAAGDSFEHEYAAAMSLYEAGKYDDALRAFEAAYQVKQLPGLLFNMAQAHRKLGHAKEALSAYQRYLAASPSLDPSLRSKVESYISQMQALLGTTPQVPTPEVEVEPPPAPLRTMSPEANTADSTRAARPLRVSKWVLLGGGLAGAGVGGILLGLDGHRGCPSAPYCATELDTKTAGIVTLATSGAVLIGAVVMFGLDARAERKRR